MNTDTTFSDRQLLTGDAFRRRVIIVCLFIFLMNIPASTIQILSSDGGRLSELMAALVVGLVTLSGLVCALRSWHVLFVTRLAFYVGAVAILVFWGANGGLTGHFTPTLVSLPLISALLFGSRDTVISSVLLGFVIAGFYLFNSSLPTVTFAADDALIISTATLGCVLLVVAMIVVFLARESEQRELKLRALLEERSYAATHDDLTDLSNRAAVTEYLNGLDPNKDRADVFMLDLDGFKHVNDTYGHDVGDDVLIKVAAVLEQATPDGALVARLGGDEFLVAMRIDQNDPVQELRHVNLGDALADALDLNFEFDGSQCAISGSVGSARFPIDALTGKDVRRLADIALYRAKHLGKSRHTRFHKSMIEARSAGILKASA